MKVSSAFLYGLSEIILTIATAFTVSTFRFIPVETTECGTQTEWDEGDDNGRCIGNGSCDGNCDGDGVHGRCIGDGDGTRNGDTIVTVMDGATAAVMDGTMTTAFDGDDGNMTVTTAMNRSAAIEEVEDYDGICFMLVKILDAFIRRGTSHAAKC